MCVRFSSAAITRFTLLSINFSSQSLVNIWISRLEARTSFFVVEKRLLRGDLIVKAINLSDNNWEISCEQIVSEKGQPKGNTIKMNACCSVVKFFVVLMNLVFWVCNRSILERNTSRSYAKIASDFAKNENFSSIPKRFFFVHYSSREKNAKTTPLSHTPTHWFQHRNTSNKRSIMLRKYPKYCVGDEVVFAVCSNVPSSRWRSLVNMGFSAQFPWKERMKIQFLFDGAKMVSHDEGIFISDTVVKKSFEFSWFMRRERFRDWQKWFFPLFSHRFRRRWEKVLTEMFMTLNHYCIIVIVITFLLSTNAS